ncbi:hypothetical protein QYF61_017397 [Mycteria americana]|uniref:Uncharacterized protein n=1 Tax=Mycteria americana TaxID=33587 RepID=A0AAN7NG31_MYCAM|nr:hypothetical protein QYF61_017397 [Mycteria americana]
MVPRDRSSLGQSSHLIVGVSTRQYLPYLMVLMNVYNVFIDIRNKSDNKGENAVVSQWGWRRLVPRVALQTGDAHPPRQHQAACARGYRGCRLHLQSYEELLIRKRDEQTREPWFTTRDCLIDQKLKMSQAFSNLFPYERTATWANQGEKMLCAVFNLHRNKEERNLKLTACVTKAFGLSLKRKVFHPSDRFRGPPLDLLQQLHVLLVLRAPELGAVLQVGSHQNRAESQNHLPRPAGHAALDAAQDTVGLLGCERTLSAHVQLFIHQYPQVLLLRAALDSVIPQPVLIPAVAATQMQDPALGLVEPHEVHMGHFLSLSRSLWMTSHPSGRASTVASAVFSKAEKVSVPPHLFSRIFAGITDGKHSHSKPPGHESVGHWKAGSKTDPPLAKAEPISDGGRAPGITPLRRGEKPAQLQPERGGRICERSSSADTKAGEEGGEEVLQAPEQRFPCGPW